MSQYKTIEGIRYSAELLNLATTAAGEDGTGKIDMSTVEKMFALLSSDNRYSELEKRTVGYIRANFEFAEDADAHFRKEIRSWAGKRAKRKKSGLKSSFKVKHFDEYVNEETGEVFDSLAEWGRSITPSAWEGLQTYLYEYDCEYIVETLDDGTKVDSENDYKRGYEIRRFMYRGCDGKIYGFFIQNWDNYGEEVITEFQEFVIKEQVIYVALPSDNSASSWWNNTYYQ